MYIFICMYVCLYVCVGSYCEHVYIDGLYTCFIIVLPMYGHFILRVSSLHTTCHFTVHALYVYVYIYIYLTNTNKIKYCFQILLIITGLTHHL